MSIASEISRLQTAKADIKTAIEAKGVTVPSNAKLDDYDTYVSQISGGPSSAKLLSVIDGSVTSIAAEDLGNITYLRTYSFTDCPNLTSVTLPNTVTTIGLGAFYKCTSLSSVTLPNSLTSIGIYDPGPGAFEKTAITSINDPNSIANINIPTSVTNLGGYSFAETGITSANLGALTSLTHIRFRCFWNCTSLSSITLPVSITEIGEYVFDNCTSLTALNYLGTKAQWNSNVNLGPQGHYHSITVIHCTDGDLPWPEHDEN